MKITSLQSLPPRMSSPVWAKLSQHCKQVLTACRLAGSSLLSCTPCRVPWKEDERLQDALASEKHTQDSHRACAERSKVFFPLPWFWCLGPGRGCALYRSQSPPRGPSPTASAPTGLKRHLLSPGTFGPEMVTTNPGCLTIPCQFPSPSRNRP